MFTYGSPRGQKNPNRTNLQKVICSFRTSSSPEVPPLSRAGRARHWGGSRRPRAVVCWLLWSRKEPGRRCLQTEASAGRWWCWAASTKTACTPSRGVSLPAGGAPQPHTHALITPSNRRVRLLFGPSHTWGMMATSDSLSLMGQVCFMHYILKYLVDFSPRQKPNTFVWFPCVNIQADIFGSW